MAKVFTLITLCFLLITASANAQISNHIVISQIYGGGGNSGAPYTNDFVELFNPTASDVPLTGYSIQYTSAAGTTWNSKVDLTGTIAAGKYFLISLAAGGTTGVALPTPDQTSPASGTGSVNMNAAAGKVALVNSTTPLAGDCPLDNPSVVDFIGYGTTASCSEPFGSPVTPAAAPSNTSALFRNLGGCVDLNVNATDFTEAAPAPRNSSVSNNCGVLPLNLVSFRGSLNSNNAVQLAWNTANEQNVNEYNLERSSDGTSFTGITNIQAVNRSEASYTFTDSKPLSGTNYYRLKMSGKDGTIKYSNVVAINNSKGISASVFPNPVVNSLSITHSRATKGALLKILNAEGRQLKLYNVEVGAVQTSLGVNELLTGTYVLVFENNGERIITRFVKQ